MMKSLALLMAIVSTANATKKEHSTIQETLNHIDKGSLLRKARVLRNQQYYNGSNKANYQYASQDLNGIEVDSSLLVEFEECTSLTMLNDQVMAGMEKGNIFEASKDFVIFSATNHNKHAKKRFAIDIPTFLSSMAQTILSDNYNFCQTCAQAQYYCGYMQAGKNSYSNKWQQNSYSEQQNPYRQPDSYDNQNDNYSAQERYDMYRHYNNGGGQSYESSQSYQKSYAQQYGNYRMNGGNRNLQQAHVTETVDCETCQSVCAEQSSTYTQNSNNYDYNQGGYANYQAFEWLRGLSECEQVNYGNYYNMNNQKQQQQQAYSQVYNELYAGLMCNADGTGIEVGIFMDEECSVWNPSKSFKSILVEGTLPYFYYTKTKNLVQFIFTKQIGCGETEYMVPYDDEGYGENYNKYDYGNYGYAQVNDGCQYLFEGSVLNIGGTCGNTVIDGDGNYVMQDSNPTAGKYTYFSSSGWSTYQYDISDQDSDGQLCTAIQQQVENGETHTTNAQSKKDNLYNYNTRTTSLLEDSNLAGEVLFVIIVGMMLAISLLHFIRKSYFRQQNSRKEPLISP